MGHWVIILLRSICLRATRSGCCWKIAQLENMTFTIQWWHLSYSDHFFLFHPTPMTIMLTTWTVKIPECPAWWWAAVPSTCPTSALGGGWVLSRIGPNNSPEWSPSIEIEAMLFDSGVSTFRWQSIVMMVCGVPGWFSGLSVWVLVLA